MIIGNSLYVKIEAGIYFCLDTCHLHHFVSYTNCPHEAHLHRQKPKYTKPGFFVAPFTLPEKPITFWVFGKKSTCAKTPNESHIGFLVRGAHARLLAALDSSAA